MRADQLRFNLEAAVDRLNRYPTRCYECVDLGPQHSVSCSAELTLFRTEVKPKGFYVHTANGNIGVVARRIGDDLRTWPKIIQRLLSSEDRRTSVEVEVRESLTPPFESYVSAMSQWVDCSRLPKRTLAPKYDVAVFRVGVMRQFLEKDVEKCSSARISDIPSSLANEVMQALAIVDSAAAASASIPYPAVTDDTHRIVKHRVSNALAFALIERGIVGKVNPSGRTIVFRPSLEHVTRKIIDLISSTQANSKADPFREPIFAFVGREEGIDKYRNAIVGCSPISFRCSFIGLQEVVDFDGCPYDSVVFVPKNYSGEELPAIQASFSTSIFTTLSSQLLPKEVIDAVDNAIRQLQGDVGLSFRSTKIPYDVAAAQIRTYLKESSQNIYEVYRDDFGDAELFVKEPIMWQRVLNTLDLHVKGEGKQECIQTLKDDKTHNDLRSKIMQKVKNHDLFFHQVHHTDPSGRVVISLSVGPRQKQKATPLPAATDKRLPLLPAKLPPVAVAPPLSSSKTVTADERLPRPSGSLSAKMMEVVQPPYRDAPGRTLNMAAHALYELIAPNQAMLPAGWEYRVKNTASTEMSDEKNDREMVLINHVTRKGYAGIQTPEGVHRALHIDGGEVAFASALLSGQPVLPFT